MWILILEKFFLDKFMVPSWNIFIGKVQPNFGKVERDYQLVKQETIWLKGISEAELIRGHISTAILLLCVWFGMNILYI